MNARIISNEEIDRKKWDDSLLNFPGSLIYSQSFYLDAMCKWDALVVGDYEALMPLPNRKKWKINYLYQPAFTQQLGIIGNVETDAALEIVSQKYPFAEIALNHNNSTGKIFKPCNNFILNLSAAYKNIKAGYSSSLKSNLNWLQKFELNYSAGNGYYEAVDLFQSLYGKKMSSVTAEDYTNFKTLCSQLYTSDNLVLRTATAQNNQLAALVLMLKDKNRLYNVISCSTDFGRSRQANYFIYDKIIEEFSGSGLIFDFEGSDIKGIADFYKKFGTINQPYPFIKWNNLPAIVKFLKK
ncbi:MAG TPA: hypothetical protein PK872_06915 [Ferruginibacter sp.]|nr:hypothetical protein [Ferruginibacter sp.]